LFDLSGKVAVVTGATKGIGLGIVQALAEAGAKVVLSSRDQSACDEVAADLDKQYGRGEVIAKGVACDLDKLEDVERLAEPAREAFGGVDILVAGGSKGIGKAAALLLAGEKCPPGDRSPWSGPEGETTHDER